MMKARTETHQPRRAKLPPILELDDENPDFAAISSFARPRWSSDEDQPNVSLDEWPTEYDD
jgi:hypothetical protein